MGTRLNSGFAAIVLAGGRSRRMEGRNKVVLPVEGEPLVATAVAAVEKAERVALVGALGPLQEALGTSDWDPRWVQTQEEPAFGGPVAGILAGLGALAHCPSQVIAILACDIPQAPAAIRRLLDSDELESLGRGVDAVCALADDGYIQWLLGFYRRGFLEQRAREVPGRDISVRHLMDPAVVRTVELEYSLLQDLDTPRDVEDYLRRRRKADVLDAQQRARED